jgi:hypothetical protein
MLSEPLTKQPSHQGGYKRAEEKKLQKNFNPDPGKWLLCKLMVKQGYSETDVAKHMKKNETLRARKSQFG